MTYTRQNLLPEKVLPRKGTEKQNAGVRNFVQCEKVIFTTNIAINKNIFDLKIHKQRTKNLKVKLSKIECQYLTVINNYNLTHEFQHNIQAYFNKQQFTQKTLSLYSYSSYQIWYL